MTFAAQALNLRVIMQCFLYNCSTLSDGRHPFIKEITLSRGAAMFDKFLLACTASAAPCMNGTRCVAPHHKVLSIHALTPSLNVASLLRKKRALVSNSSYHPMDSFLLPTVLFASSNSHAPRALFNEADLRSLRTAVIQVFSNLIRP